MWISLVLLPTLLAQTLSLLLAAAPPLAAGPLPPALAAAVLPPELHAANASTLTAASAPTLDRFIRSLLQITGRNRLPRSGPGPCRRSSAAASIVACPPRRRCPSVTCGSRNDGGIPIPGGVQVAAEAMPYISGRRPECNNGRPHPATCRERAFAHRR